MSEAMVSLARYVESVRVRRRTGVDGYSPPPEAEPCSVCGGIGWLLSAAPFGTRDFGRLERCRCAGEGELGEERLRRYAQLDEVEGLTFGLAAARGVCGEAIEAARRWVELDPDERGGFVAIGPSGSGKTALCGAAANGLLERGEGVVYARASVYLERLRGFIGENQNAYDRTVERLEGAPTLVLDGLGADSELTAWGRERLRDLVIARWARSSPTMLASSVGFEGMDAHVASRVGDPERCVAVWLEGGGAVVAAPDADLERLMKRMRFETFVVGASGRDAGDSPARALERARRFAVAPQGVLLLMGPTGVGKTHLAVAVCAEAVERGEDVMFSRVADLLDAMRPGGDSGAFERARETGLLVLDDLGAENPTAWSMERLLQIVDRRLLRSLPIVVTTNLDLGAHGGRIASRLCDRRVSSGVWIQAKDARKAGPAKRSRANLRRRR